MWKNDALDDVQKDLLNHNIIVIGGDIDDDTAFYVRESLIRLMGKGSPAVKILITSLGGLASVGLDIYDMLTIYPGETTAVVHAFAYSTAAVILQACKKRTAARHSKILIHHVSSSEVSLDILRDSKRTAKEREELEKMQARIYKILCEKTKLSMAKIKKECARDRAMDAEEALKFGLIDEII